MLMSCHIRNSLSTTLKWRSMHIWTVVSVNLPSRKSKQKLNLQRQGRNYRLAYFILHLLYECTFCVCGIALMKRDIFRLKDKGNFTVRLFFSRPFVLSKRLKRLNCFKKSPEFKPLTHLTFASHNPNIDAEIRNGDWVRSNHLLHVCYHLHCLARTCSPLRDHSLFMQSNVALVHTLH